MPKCTVNAAPVSDSDGSTATGDESIEGEPDTTLDWSSAEEEDGAVRHTLFDKAKSWDHKLNHKPGMPKHCEECFRGKMRRKRRFAKNSKRIATKFGQQVTCDHVLMKDWFKLGGVGSYNDVLNFYDYATGWRASVPTFGLDTFEPIRP